MNICQISVIVTLSGGSGSPTATCGIVVGSGLGSLLKVVQRWCGQLFSWMAYSSPGTVVSNPQFQVNVMMKKELSCTAITAQEFTGQTIMNHEVWKCVII